MISGAEAVIRFGLKPQEILHWNVLSYRLAKTGRDPFLMYGPVSTAEDWFGMYAPRQTNMPVLVLQGKDLLHRALSVPATTVYLQEVEQAFVVQGRSRTLVEVTQAGAPIPLTLVGTVFAVRVVATTRGQ
jgi:hypothetical protein